MFFQAHQEQQNQSNEKKFKELQIQLETLTTEIDDFLQEHGINLPDIHEHFENEENFTSHDWQKVQKLEKEHQQRLEALKSQADPRATQQKYAERSTVDPRWLFVR